MKLVPRSVQLRWLLGIALVCGLTALALYLSAAWRTHSFLRAVRTAPGVTLLEGLPHQMWESEALRSERQSKTTLQRKGFDFYEGRIAVSTEDSAELRKILETEGTLEQWAWALTKKCGGFHPDWLLEWTATDGTRFEMLLCFGCGEAKVFGPNGMSYYDLKASAADDLEEILKRYRKLRPARKG